MPVIIAGVVDEDADGAVLGGRRGDGRAQGLDVPEIAANEIGRAWPAAAILAQSALRRRFGDIDEGDLGPLLAEMRHDALADAAAAAGDEDHRAFEAREDGGLVDQSGH